MGEQRCDPVGTPLPRRRGLLPCSLLLLLGVLHMVLPVTRAQDLTNQTQNGTLLSSLIQFHYPQPNGIYRSSDKFDPKGMEHLYTITNLFLDLIQPKQFPPDIFVNNTDDISVILLEKKEELLQYYVGLVAVACVGVLLSIALPIIGLVFCMCRCAGRCGAHTEPYEKRYDPCKRHTLGVFLSTFVIVILFGIVCGFVTNEYIEKGVSNLPDSLNDSLDDISLYINNTKDEMNTLLNDNFLQLQDALDALLDRTGDIVKKRLAETSKASAIDNLTSIVDGLLEVHSELRQTIQGTRSLKIQVRQLDESLQGVNARLRQQLDSCTDSSCIELRKEYNANSLTVTDNLNKLPDVSSVAQRLENFIQNDIATEVKKGKQSLDRISIQVQEAVNNTIPEIKKLLRQVGQELKNYNQNITVMIDKFQEKIQLSKGKQGITVVQNYIKEYGPIRYYAGLGMCCAVLLITTCLVCGLFCGFCGQKPHHHYNGDSCNKGSGAGFLIAAVYLMFLFSIFLMALTTLFFLVGGLVERIVCDPVQDPEGGEFYKVADLYLPLVNIYPNNRLPQLKTSEVVRKCNQNFSAHDVLNLDSILNISEVINYKQRYRLNEYVDDLRRRIALNPAVLILTEQARRQLQDLSESQFAKIDFDRFIELLQQPVTPISLADVQQKLREVITHLEVTRPNMASSLSHEADMLTILQREVVTNITKTMITIETNLKNLQSNVFFNKTSFRDLIQDLLFQAEHAQLFIQTQGKTEVLNLADEFTRNFTEYLDEYADHVEYQVRNVIGQCGPVSLAFNSSVISVCKGILNPFNGFWASMGWCILLFLPCIFFSVFLSAFYRKTDPYPGPLVESESLYDTYRDNIPLANVHKKKRRNRRHHETYDNRNGYVPDYMLTSSDEAARFRREAYPHPGRSNPGEAGYSRMDTSPPYHDPPYKPTAPGDWSPPDFSSNSNLASPADFERPPPYYFPGPDSSKY